MSVYLGSIGGISVRAKPSAFLWSVVLWAAATEFSQFVLKTALPLAIIEGLAIVAIHWASDIAHQLGHALAARRVGHPMQRISLWFLLSSGLYPADEPELPPAAHRARALGGPTMSVLIALATGIIAWAMLAAGNHYAWLAVFASLDNLVVLCIGAFLPLGFNDGSTLLRLRRAAR
ncbi:MAG TPA: hypothetical protein VF807_14220 [Ktedonobacterales bacterium]